MAADFARRGGLRLGRFWLWRLQFSSWTHVWMYEVGRGDGASSLVPILAFWDHLGDVAVFGSIFGRGVALGRFGADVRRLRRGFGPYMGPPLVALTRS